MTMVLLENGTQDLKAEMMQRDESIPLILFLKGRGPGRSRNQTGAKEMSLCCRR
jgi:hypothetical protein